MPYSEFADMLRDDRIAEVKVGERVVETTLKKPLPDGRKQVLAVRVDPSFAQELEAAKVKYSGAAENTWVTTLLYWLAPAVIFFFIWNFFARRVGQGLGSIMSVGQSRAKVFMEKDVKVGFADVAGVDAHRGSLRAGALHCALRHLHRRAGRARTRARHITALRISASGGRATPA
ncbi:hypothetical protein LG047_13355 [Methylocystis sp. WRRC1]|nr:hypothetical protein [Methylocystis sp. WRRC1]